jgi:hypothetical protein
MKNVGFLETSPGNFSSTRLMFIIGLVWSIFFTSYGALVLKWTPGECIAVFTATSGVFIALKLGQKPMENKVTEPKIETNGNPV